MKHIYTLLALLLSITTLPAIAQQSCSFIIHVDGDNGTDDIQCGTEGSPCETINYGIQRADSEASATVRIAITQDPYEEIVELVDGISLWGGFDSQWNLVGSTEVEGGLDINGQVYTIKAENINSTTVISGLHILAPNALVEGNSSYGIHVVNSTGLVLQQVSIQGGAGLQGAAGTDGTDSNIDAANGTNGGQSDEFNTACNDDDSGDGGTGAVTTGYPNTAGGNGGRGGYMDEDCSGFPDLSATNGVNGANAAVWVVSSHGYRGSGGGTCNDGNDGNDGLTVHGTGGTGATTSATISGNFWAPTTADPGTLGDNGTGGGGGGGSGGCDDGTDAYGAGGGGGGSGGIAAPTAGTGAQSGGNSVCLFLVNSTCAVIDCDFTLGTGALGGTGGASGQGTPGGTGGSGGTGPGTGNGGDGGDGGDGGNSGAGGGGAAGSAYGIYGVNSTVNRSGGSFDGGTAGIVGQGGTGAPTGVEGENGAEGEVVNVAGTITDNTGQLALEPDPCVEITTADVSNLEFCAGDTTTVTFTAMGSFSGGNVFTAQLSDASGDFSSAVDIGILASASPGPITVTFPSNTPLGSGYRIRVNSSASPSIGNENTTDITINPLPAVVANASAATICAGEEVTLTGSGADSYLWSNGVTDGLAFLPLTSGYYTVLGTDNNTQCFNFDSVLVTVNQLPDTTVAVNGNQLGAVLGGATYQWLDCDNNFAPINGEESQTFTPSSSGNYAVVVSQNNCADTSSCYNIMAVGMSDSETEETVLLLYPNPSTGQFQMITNVTSPMEITVFNVSGQTVFSKANVTSNDIVDITGVDNGMYYIRFSTDEMNLLRHVIIQR